MVDFGKNKVKKKHSYLYEQLNSILREHITGEFFTKIKPVSRRIKNYNLFQKDPLRYLRVVERNTNRFKQVFKTKTSNKTTNPIIRFVLKRRGWNYMEEFNEAYRNADTETKRKMREVKDKVLKKDKEKHSVVMEEIKKLGFTGVALKEMNNDIKEIYDKVKKGLQNKEVIDKDDLPLVYLMRQLRNDELALIKFGMTMGLKEKELELKYKSNSKTPVIDINGNEGDVLE